MLRLLNAGKNAFKKLHKTGKYNPKDLFDTKEYRELIEETHKVFVSSFSTEMSDELKAYLSKDAFIFSGLKTHAQLTEARNLLRTKEGKIKPYHEFEQDILKINPRYNEHYLQAEYEFAVQSSLSADYWSSLSDDSDRYWLQYRTASDDRVRVSHQKLHDITLPKDDAFWDSYMPPNGWRCRCRAVEVRAKKYQKSDSKEAMERGNEATTEIGKIGKNKLEMFRFNPGKELKLFPPKNSYTKVVGASEARKQVEKLHKQSEINFKPRNEQFKKISKNVYEHLLVKKEDDYAELKTIAKELAKNGKRTELLPEINEKERTLRSTVFPNYKKSLKTNPDLRNGNEYFDLKRPQSIRRILKNANKASNQGAIAIISDSFLDKKLTDRIMDERAKDIFKSKEYKMNTVVFKIGKKLIVYNRTRDK